MRILKRQVALLIACLLLVQDSGLVRAEGIDSAFLNENSVVVQEVLNEDVDNEAITDDKEEAPEETGDSEDEESVTDEETTSVEGEASDEELAEETVMVSTKEVVAQAIAEVVYQSNGNGTATVKGFTGEGLEVADIWASTVNGDVVTSISANAFKGCTTLREVKLPNTIKTISKEAFSGCTALTTITLPSGLERLGEKAFYNCSSLAAINIPKNIEVAGTAATAPFIGCTHLTSVTFENGIEEITKYMFAHCESLTTVTIPDTVIYIEDYAFAGCTSLTGVVLPENLMTLGASAFKGCTSLTSINLPAEIATTENKIYAPFAGSGIKTATFSAITASIPKNILAGCKELESVNIDSTFEDLREIEDGAFAGCEKLRTITIPENVKVIGANAFAGCASLTEVTLPEKIETLGMTAFENCTSLAKVNIPKKLKTQYTDKDEVVKGIIADKVNFKGPFAGCTSLVNERNITISSDIETMPAYLFAGCSGLTSYKVPSYIKKLDTRAFSCAENLVSVELKDETVTLAENVFTGAKKLERINIPNKLTTTATQIERAPFYGCESLNNIVFDIDPDDKDDIVSIPAYMFAGIDGLKEIEIPNTVTSVGNYAFNRCKNLKKIVAPSSIKSVGTGAFLGCDQSLVVYCANNSAVYKYCVANGIATQTTNYVQEIKVTKKGSSTEIKTISMVAGEEINLAATVTPTNATDKTLSWKVVDDDLALVKAVSGTSLEINLKATKAGSTTLKVKAVEGGYTKDIKLNVDPIPKNGKLVARVKGIPKAGLICGETANMFVYLQSNMSKPLSPTFFDFTSDNVKYATVNKNGLITSTYANAGTKTVNITATLKNDAQKRSVTIPVTVTAIPVDRITMEVVEKTGLETTEYAVNGDASDVTIEKDSVKSKARTFGIKVTPYDESNNKLDTTEFEWVSSDSSKVSLNVKNNTAIVTIAAGAAGNYYVKAVSKDANKAVGALYIYVNDYKPRLAVSKITVDTNRSAFTKVRVIEAYGNTVSGASITTSGTNSGAFEARYTREDGLEIAPTTYLANGTYKCYVNFETVKGDMSAPLSVEVKNSIPQKLITLKRSKFNLFYKDSTSDITITPSGKYRVESVEQVTKDADTFAVSSASLTQVDDKGKVKVKVTFRNQENPKAYYGSNNKPVTKLMLRIKFVDYRDPFYIETTIPTETKKATVATSRKSTVFYTLNPGDAPFTSNTLVFQNSKTKEFINASGGAVTLQSVSEGYVNFAGGKLTPILNDTNTKFERGNKTKVSLKFNVQEENWMNPIVVSHTVSVNSKKAAPELKTSVSLGGKTNPSVKLNANAACDKVILSSKVSAMDCGLVENGISVLSGNEYGFFDINYDEDSKKLSVGIANGKTVSKGKYVVKLHYNVENVDGKPVKVNDAKLTINVYSKTLSPSIKATGKFDTIQRSTGITYTLNKVNNLNLANMAVIGVELTDKDSSSFRVAEIKKDAKGKYSVLVAPKAGVALNIKSKYGYTMKYYLAPIMEDGTIDSDVSKVTTFEKSYKNIKMNQSKLTVTSSGNTIYPANKGNTGKIKVTIKSPAKARVAADGFEITDISSDLKRCITITRVNYEEDGTIVLDYVVENPAAVIIGGTYNIKCTITPDGMDKTNTKPTVANVSIKVAQ